MLSEYLNVLEDCYKQKEAIYYIAGMEDYAKVIRYLGVLQDELID